MNQQVYLVMFVDSYGGKYQRHISGKYIYEDKEDAENWMKAFKEKYPQHEWYIQTLELVPSGNG